MREAVSALLEALSVRGEVELLAAGRPSRRLEVDIRRTDLWGVTVAELGELPPVRRTPVVRGTVPALTGPATERAASEFEELLEILLEVSSRELLVRRLAAAVFRTTRQLNTLEQRVAPELESSIEEARRVLEEREREEHLRIRQLLRRRGRAQTSTPRARSPA
jgi:H(+)-transporting ATP synthase subunit D